ncbi:unnamed protein product [Blepharisma stoltei]|uniref:Uncharacterized protein n=1 Tax=Blepharisma stoltei TaxID=1481888 RepID=A0AAU9KDP2_9CILI|nr:unnamed protein product [Blepharisma stoltei]
MSERTKFCKSRSSVIVAPIQKPRITKRLSFPDIPLELPKLKLSCRSVTFPIIKRDRVSMIIQDLHRQQGTQSPRSPDSGNKSSSSLWLEKLPTTIKKEVKAFRIKKRFQNMNDFNRRIPQDDPLECYYENLPYIEDVLQENREKHYQKMSKLILPVYEESNESVEMAV